MVRLSLRVTQNRQIADIKNYEKRKDNQELKLPTLENTKLYKIHANNKANISHFLNPSDLNHSFKNKVYCFYFVNDLSCFLAGACC